MYNHLATEAAAPKGGDPIVDAACVARYGSVFPFCLPDSSTAAAGSIKLSSSWNTQDDETTEDLQKLLEVS